MPSMKIILTITTHLPTSSGVEERNEEGRRLSRYFTGGWKDFVTIRGLARNSRVRFTGLFAPQYLLYVKVLEPEQLQREAPTVEVPVSKAPPSKKRKPLSEAEVAADTLLSIKVLCLNLLFII